MPTKKGKSKPGKAKKASNKLRRTRVGGTGKTKRAAAARGTGASKRTGARKRSAGKLRRTEAGPVWVGSSPAPVNLPAEDPGSNKATDGGGSDRVRIL